MGLRGKKGDKGSRGANGGPQGDGKWSTYGDSMGTSWGMLGHIALNSKWRGKPGPGGLKPDGPKEWLEAQLLRGRLSTN